MAQNHDTFHQLYCTYAPAVRRFAITLAGNSDDADDIVAETFLRVWTAPNDLRMESVKAYLFAIARNLHLRRQEQKRRQTPLTEAIPDHTADPEQNAAVQSEVAAVRHALATLPELDRSLLLLSAEEGLSYRAIGALTGLTVAAIKVRIFRARARLQKILTSSQEKLP